MKKILISIDYNPSAEKVAEAGYALAKAMKADVTLAHVMAEPAYYAADFSPIMGYQGVYTSGILDVIDGIKKEAGEFLAAAAKHLGDPAIKTKVLAGNNIGDAILEYAEIRKIDLIVVGSHRHHGLERLLIPDVAVHIAKHSKIPLFIIPTLEN